MLLVLLFSSLRWSVQGISLPTQYTVQVHTLNTDATGGVSTAVSGAYDILSRDRSSQSINFIIIYHVPKMHTAAPILSTINQTL